MRRVIIGVALVGALVAGAWFWRSQATVGTLLEDLRGAATTATDESLDSFTPVTTVISSLGQALQIETLRKGSYPGSPILVEETLTPGSNYQRYRVSYLSEGLKIYALMTIPNGQKPEAGWPVIIFNHGYIPPAEYRTAERYIAYVDALARAGYIVFRSDYRGHDQSEGEPTGAYGHPGYTVDVLNAVSSVKQHPDANPGKIGMWGHSMGGYITLRSMVITKDVKVGVIWAGVVADYADLLTNWRRRTASGSPTPVPTPSPGSTPTLSSRRWRDVFQAEFGSPTENRQFWDSISANAFVNDISGPVQIHHAKGDASVPWEFSQNLADDLQAANKEHELYIYEGDDHNLTTNFGLAMRRTVEYFDQYLKDQ